MSKAIPKECMALLTEASEMFSETGCVPGIDGEEVSAETIVPNAKEYISETIDDPEAIYDPEQFLPAAPGHRSLLHCSCRLQCRRTSFWLASLDPIRRRVCPGFLPLLRDLCPKLHGIDRRRLQSVRVCPSAGWADAGQGP